MGRSGSRLLAAHTIALSELLMESSVELLSTEEVNEVFNRSDPRENLEFN